MTGTVASISVVEMGVFLFRHNIHSGSIRAQNTKEDEKMKKIVALIVATSITVMAGAALAAQANLSVTANVTGVCSITGGTLAFGELTPLTAPLVTANSAGVAVACTNGTAYTLGADKGTASDPGVLTNGSSNIDYTISFTGSGTGTGSPVAVPIMGTIAAGTYKDATPGTYTDTIVLTVTP